MSCKHGLESEEVCWLCKGKSQSQPLGYGPPPWFINSTQMAIRTNYAVCGGKILEDTPHGTTSMPKGSSSPEAKELLPFKKFSQDNKTYNKYKFTLGKKLE